MKHRLMTLRSYQKGVSLIEVMVAVLVLSIAFIGMAALQATSLSTGNSSMARSAATILTYSIQDAMRADRANALNGVYNNGGKAIVASSCPATDGTLAKAQINAWCSAMGTSLGAQSTTTGIINCVNSGVCTVTVQFDDSRSGAGGSATQQVTTTGML